MHTGSQREVDRRVSSGWKVQNFHDPKDQSWGHSCIDPKNPEEEAGTTQAVPEDHRKDPPCGHHTTWHKRPILTDKQGAERKNPNHRPSKYQQGPSGATGPRHHGHFASQMTESCQGINPERGSLLWLLWCLRNRIRRGVVKQDDKVKPDICIARQGLRFYIFGSLPDSRLRDHHCHGCVFCVVTTKMRF